MGPVTGVSYTGNGDPATLLHTDKKTRPHAALSNFINQNCFHVDFNIDFIGKESSSSKEK